MNSKGHKTTKPKVMDVTKSKKTSASTAGGSAQRVIIQSRPIIASDSPAGNDSASEPTTAPTLTASKKVIVPISSGDSDKPESPKQETAKPESKEAADQASKPATDPGPAKPAEEDEETPAAPAADPESDKEQESSASAPESSDDTDNESGDDKKPSPETQKAVEEAAKAAAREKEVEEYIDKREFYVPINAVARKRSVKVSAGLTVLVLLLAVVLIDLMLDTGVVLLVQKIPHTHFFTTNSANK